MESDYQPGQADQFAGCLIGQALGDALGFIVEGRPSHVCTAYVESSLRPRRVEGHSRGRFRIGQYSDDTQLARELVLSFVACGGFKPEDYAHRIAALFTESRIVGRGRSTEQAAYRIAAGVSWEESGTPAPAAGNGSAMRAAPIGLFFAEDPQAMVKAAHDQGRITHRDPRCSAGAVAIAGTTSIVLRERQVEATSLCSRLATWTQPFDPVLSEALGALPSWVEEPPENAVKKIARVGIQPDYTDGWEGISPFVTGSVLWSIYSFLRSPGDYWEAVCTAIAVGGDVDTTAAMTGAIAGTSLGLNGIPQEMARIVSDQGTWGYDELAELAGECHALLERMRQPAG